MERVPPRIDQRPAELDRSRDRHRNVHGRLRQSYPAGGDPTDVHQVVHEPRQMLDLAGNDVTGLLHDRVTGVAHAKNVDRRHERSQRVAQLVREHRQEHVSALMGLLERDDPVMLRQVTSGEGETAQPSVGIPKHGHRDVGPEALISLAHEPPLRIYTAILRSCRPVLLRKPALDTFGGIEAREVSANDLRGGEAIEALCAPIPTLDDTVRVEHEQRVILHFLDKQPKSLLALAQHFFVTAAFGEIARDLEETGQLAGSVTQCRDDHACPEAGSVFAQSPSLILHPSLAGGDLQLLVWPAVRERSRLIEGGEMSAENLGGLISLDVLRAVVPAGDVPRGIEGENGIVLDTGHQLLENPALLGIRSRGGPPLVSGRRHEVRF